MNYRRSIGPGGPVEHPPSENRAPCPYLVWAVGHASTWRILYQSQPTLFEPPLVADDETVPVAAIRTLAQDASSCSDKAPAVPCFLGTQRALAVFALSLSVLYHFPFSHFILLTGRSFTSCASFIAQLSSSILKQLVLHPPSIPKSYIQPSNLRT